MRRVPNAARPDRSINRLVALLQLPVKRSRTNFELPRIVVRKRRRWIDAVSKRRRLASVGASLPPPPSARLGPATGRVTSRLFSLSVSRPLRSPGCCL